MRNRYLQSVTEAGGIPVVLPLSVSWDDVSWLLGRVDGFLIMGATDLLARVLGKIPRPPRSSLKMCRLKTGGSAGLIRRRDASAKPEKEKA